MAGGDEEFTVAGEGEQYAQIIYILPKAVAVVICLGDKKKRRFCDFKKTRAAGIDYMFVGEVICVRIIDEEHVRFVRGYRFNDQRKLKKLGHLPEDVQLYSMGSYRDEAGPLDGYAHVVADLLPSAPLSV